jgi:DNA-directed RNA polymerase alpha subunit
MNRYLSCIESKILAPTSFYGRFALGHFPRGETLTVANTLRRGLLSQLTGLALSCVYIQGPKHEYQGLVGVKECVLDILLNLKQVVLSGPENLSPQVAFLNVSGPGTVYAKHIKLPYFVHCVNPNQAIAVLNEKGTLQMKLLICCGVGYLNVHPGSKTHQDHVHQLESLFQDNQRLLPRNHVDWRKLKEQLKDPSFNIESLATPDRIVQPGYFPVDSLFSPVTKVNYTIEDTTDQTEMIVLEIWTNGGIDPRSAIHRATRAVIHLFLPWQTKPTAVDLYQRKESRYFEVQSPLPQSTSEFVTAVVRSTTKQFRRKTFWVEANTHGEDFSNLDKKYMDLKQKLLELHLNSPSNPDQLPLPSMQTSWPERPWSLTKKNVTTKPTEPLENLKLLEAKFQSKPSRLPKSSHKPMYPTFPILAPIRSDAAAKRDGHAALRAKWAQRLSKARNNKVYSKFAVDILNVDFDKDLYILLKKNNIHSVKQLTRLTPKAFYNLSFSSKQFERLYTILTSFLQRPE